MATTDTKEIPLSVVSELLEYEDGHLRWKHRDTKWFRSNQHYKAWNKNFAGKLAGHEKGNGYIGVTILSEEYLVHRVVYGMFHGYVPQIVDHIDLNRSNNRIENLREINSQGSNCNVGISVRNTSGIKGVSWNSANNLWKAQICKHGKTTYLGMYKNIEDAAAAYAAASKEIHGEFGRTA